MRISHVAREHAGALGGLDQTARDGALRVARTIADLADSSAVTDEHVREAVALTDVAAALRATSRSAA